MSDLRELTDAELAIVGGGTLKAPSPQPNGIKLVEELVVDRHLVSTLQTRTWRLHDLCGSADFMSDLCLRLVIWRA